MQIEEYWMQFWPEKSRETSAIALSSSEIPAISSNEKCLENSAPKSVYFTLTLMKNSMKLEFMHALPLIEIWNQSTVKFFWTQAAKITEITGCEGRQFRRRRIELQWSEQFPLEMKWKFSEGLKPTDVVGTQFRL
jgi:hypothetical protein